MTRRILFVDDEPFMLRGLRRMLMDYSDVWDIHYSESGSEALRLFEEQPFDIIVTDLKMPEMDGVELLDRVRREYPGTMRVILSGYSDKERLVDSIRVAHQFLSKPSSPEIVLGTVANLLALRKVSIDEELRCVITGLESLPVLPHVHDELYELVVDPASSPEVIGELVIKDMGLTTSVLKLVNTSFFGLPLNITDPTKALSLLGMDTIRRVLSRDGFVSLFDVERIRHFNQETLWSHSLTTARFSQAIVRQEQADTSEIELAYTGGMLHDLGKLILADTHPEEYGKVIGVARERNIPVIQAEKEVLHTTHVEVGAYLLGLWGFPNVIVQATSKHHSLLEAHGDLIVAAVHAANALEHELVVLNDHYAPHPVDERNLDECGFGDRFEIWRNACKNLDGSQ